MNPTIILTICLLISCPHLNSGQISSESDTSDDREKRAVLSSESDTSESLERVARDLGGAANEYQDMNMERDYKDAAMAIDAIMSAMREARGAAQTAQVRQARQFSSESEDDDVIYDITDDTEELASQDESVDLSEAEEMIKRNFQYKCDRRECNRKCSSMKLGMAGSCGTNGRCYCNRKKAKNEQSQGMY